MRILDVDRVGLYTRRAGPEHRGGEGVRPSAVPSLHGCPVATSDRGARVPTARARGSSGRLRAATRDRGRGGGRAVDGGRRARRRRPLHRLGRDRARDRATSGPARRCTRPTCRPRPCRWRRPTPRRLRPRGDRRGGRPLRARGRRAARDGRSRRREPAVPPGGRRVDAARRRAGRSGVGAVRGCRALRARCSPSRSVGSRPAGRVVVEIDAREAASISSARPSRRARTGPRRGRTSPAATGWSRVDARERPRRGGRDRRATRRADRVPDRHRLRHRDASRRSAAPPAGCSRRSVDRATSPCPCWWATPDRRARSLGSTIGRPGSPQALWPGALTLVLPRTPSSEGWDLGGDQASIGVRVPDHPLALAVLAGGALATTSANRSGEPPATTCDELVAAFGGDVEVYLCQDDPLEGAPSAVVSLLGRAARGPACPARWIRTSSRGYRRAEGRC